MSQASPEAVAEAWRLWIEGQRWLTVPRHGEDVQLADLQRLLAQSRQELIASATARMIEAAPRQLETMIEVGLTHERDAQRARERILEQVGVLDRPGSLPDGVESIDILALRIRRSMQQPHQEELGTIDGSVA